MVAFPCACWFLLSGLCYLIRSDIFSCHRVQQSVARLLLLLMVILYGKIPQMVLNIVLWVPLLVCKQMLSLWKTCCLIRSLFALLSDLWAKAVSNCECSLLILYSWCQFIWHSIFWGNRIRVEGGISGGETLLEGTRGGLPSKRVLYV